jgi:AcrR family transcriptional regulator
LEASLARKNKSEKKKIEIIKAFEDVILERGLDNVRMADVAQIVGIDRSSLHYYFPTKGALVQKVIEHIVTQYSRSEDEQVTSDDPLDRLEEYLDYSFGPNYHQPRESKLIDAIDIVSARSMTQENAVYQIYKRSELVAEKFFLNAFPDLPERDVKSTANAVHMLVEGYVVFIELGFPTERRLSARKLAMDSLEKLKLQQFRQNQK